jgi:hypothetical protein
MGWGNLADHVGEYVSCWQSAVDEYVFTEKYHLYSVCSVCWALCVYPLVISVSRWVWPPMMRLEIVFSFGLIAVATGVKMVRTRVRDWRIRRHEPIISELIHLE